MNARFLCVNIMDIIIHVPTILGYLIAVPKKPNAIKPTMLYNQRRFL